MGVEDPRFHAIKALEGDDLEKEKNANAYKEVDSLYNEHDDYEADSADKRYKFTSSELAIYRHGAPVQ